jgi:2-phospho-L-lactate guanylyltransferase (CobY/MobA/RfbA family)
MSEYFYTLDLGEIYGPKLELLAEQASQEDREAFAANMLAYAIDRIEDSIDVLLEILNHEALEEAPSDLEQIKEWRKNNRPLGADLDDEIPF